MFDMWNVERGADTAIVVSSPYSQMAANFASKPVMSICSELIVSLAERIRNVITVEDSVPFTIVLMGAASAAPC